MADRKGLSASVALGTLLIPLTAFAASMMVRNDPPVEPATSVTSTVVEPQVGAVFDTQTATAADLMAACGEAGLRLVATEADGSITDIQQAALDALREICAQEGLPLPGKPIPEPIVETVVVANASSGSSVAQSPNGDESGYEEEHEDEHEEDDD
ncbi:MAG TPA: hypothetical protein VJA46_06535 [Acidimicrobiia bacterium]|nr:hypothetical protein [Acidimicrobiia bacterium]